MLEIFVDADACPVKDEVMRVAGRHAMRVHMVANSWMRLDNDPLINRVIVPEGPDAADDWIVEHCGAGDVVITTDIPLARRSLEKGATAMRPTGKMFDEGNIGMALAMRDLTADLRDAGVIRGGGPSFSKQDRSRFLSALENAIRAIKRQHASG
ncbi:MAG: YaiI/YqxD family protein [Hyphomicrobiales bacterium]|nr:MAG: YaiI/YqxD family protein [Hyphomicrobiales bacterium]